MPTSPTSVRELRKTYDWRIQRAAQADAAAIAQRHAHYEQLAAVLPMLQQAGVTILAGTDAGVLNSFNYPGIGLHDELALYVEKGLTPAEALSSATRAGPAWFGTLDRYGAISTGKVADMVVLDRNPLDGHPCDARHPCGHPARHALRPCRP